MSLRIVGGRVVNVNGGGGGGRGSNRGGFRGTGDGRGRGMVRGTLMVGIRGAGSFR
jgi:hypothetical protein